MNDPIEVGDEVVLQVDPWSRRVVKVKRIAGLGLWVTECGMYFLREDVVETCPKLRAVPAAWRSMLKPSSWFWRNKSQ